MWGTIKIESISYYSIRLICRSEAVENKKRLTQYNTKGSSFFIEKNMSIFNQAIGVHALWRFMTDRQKQFQQRKEKSTSP